MFAEPQKAWIRLITTINLWAFGVRRVRWSGAEC
jgi:hypothetical protein